jgi:hypothetical protein
MAVNNKLTKVIKDRVITSFEADTSSIRITFEDDFTMKVKTVESPPPKIPEGGQVREVSERGKEFTIGCEADTTIDLT